ncbi:Uncharacterised protein [Legionella pneumophila]|nr:Uncharacterised protein [Legionella pneumophila]
MLAIKRNVEYTRQVIERFANDEDLKIIIVVDKAAHWF